MTLNELLTIGGMAAVTFGIRYLLVGLAGRVRLPAAAQLALAFVPPAVLTAIIVPGILLSKGVAAGLTPWTPYLPAAIVAVLAQLIFKRLLVTIVLGMAVFFVCRLLPGLF